MQNTVTNLGASIGTALGRRGAHLGADRVVPQPASRTTPTCPTTSPRKAQVELAGGIPFISDKDLETALDEAGVPPKTADAIVDENADARIDGLRASLVGACHHRAGRAVLQPQHPDPAALCSCRQRSFRVIRCCAALRRRT